MMPLETQNTEEQKLCISCGLCCDGTLHDKAFLREGEKGTLPQPIEDLYFRIKDMEFFRLPCPFFSGLCSIYHQKKALICSAFRCRLLIDFENKEIDYTEAAGIIEKAKILREEIFVLAREEFGMNYKLPFRGILKKIAERKQEIPGLSSPADGQLTAKCNILEILLLKHFKPEKEFAAMVITSEQDGAGTLNQEE